MKKHQVKEIIQDSDGFRYSVDLDPTDIDILKDIDDPECYEDLKKQFDNGELDAYVVTKEKICTHCDQSTEIDSLYGIIAESPQDALDQYLADYGG